MRFIPLFFIPILLTIQETSAQTTVFFQGFENASTTCAENWGYTGGVRNTETARTGSNSARIGRSSESNTITFNAVNISGLTGVTLQVYHSVRSGSGPGLDTREGAVFLVSLNGGAYTVISGVSGTSDYSYSWSAGSGGVTNTCPSTYTTPNPLNYNVPAGTTTISLKVVSVGKNGSTCSAFTTAMDAGNATNFDRTDEGFFIDDVKLVTTSTAIPGIWTGATSTDWFDCTNWHNNIVPTSTTDVTIDQSATNNCVVGVSATGAAVCRNLTVKSSNGTTRTLTIQNSASLTCSGNATVIKTGSNSANAKITLLNAAGFSCTDLTLTGTASGDEDAQFENEMSTAVTATVNGNLVLNNGAKLDLTNAPNYGILHLKGNYTNNGLETDFKQTNSYVYFDGTGAQSINTTGFNEIFANAVINKSLGALTLNNACEIENSFTFTNGIVNSSSAALLIFYDNATASTMSDLSHVDGPVRKIGNDAFTFPVGDNGNYQDISISAPSSTSHHFTAQYFETDPDPLYDRTSKVSSLDHISACEYWILDRTNGTSNVTVTLRWDGSSCGVTLPSDLRVAHWNGSMWQDEGNGGTTGTTTTGTVVSSAAVTYFSPFTLSSTSTENPLPLELLNFNASLQNDMVYTTWATASEQNTQFHIVERSQNGTDFEEAGRLNAAGNSNTLLHYAWYDDRPLDGTSYYRLKTVDMDGELSFSETVPVNRNGENDHVWVFYTEGIPIIKTEDNISLRVFNANGQLLKQKEMNAGQVITLDDLQNGIYLVQTVSGRKTRSVKILVSH